jgi:hypothetical protein
MLVAGYLCESVRAAVSFNLVLPIVLMFLRPERSLQTFVPGMELSSLFCYAARVLWTI